MSSLHRYEILAIEDNTGIRCTDCWNEEPEGFNSITHIYTPAENTGSDGLLCDRCGKPIHDLFLLPVGGEAS